MNEIIGVKIKVDASELAALQKELKGATQNVITLTDTFGDSSKEVAQAKAKVAELQQQIAQKVEPSGIKELATAIKNLPGINIDDKQLNGLLNSTEQLTKWSNLLKDSLAEVDGEGFAQVAAIIGGIEKQIQTISKTTLTVDDSQLKAVTTNLENVKPEIKVEVDDSALKAIDPPEVKLEADTSALENIQVPEVSIPVDVPEVKLEVDDSDLKDIPTELPDISTKVDVDTSALDIPDPLVTVQVDDSQLNIPNPQVTVEVDSSQLDQLESKDVTVNVDSSELDALSFPDQEIDVTTRVDNSEVESLEFPKRELDVAVTPDTSQVDGLEFPDRELRVDTKVDTTELDALDTSERDIPVVTKLDKTELDQLETTEQDLPFVAKVDTQALDELTTEPKDLPITAKVDTTELDQVEPKELPITTTVDTTTLDAVTVDPKELLITTEVDTSQLDAVEAKELPITTTVDTSALDAVEIEPKELPITTTVDTTQLDAVEVPGKTLNVTTEVDTSALDSVDVPDKTLSVTTEVDTTVLDQVEVPGQTLNVTTEVDTTSLDQVQIPDRTLNVTAEVDTTQLDQVQDKTVTIETKGLPELQQNLKAAVAEVNVLTEKFGESSQEVLNAKDRVKELQDQIVQSVEPASVNQLAAAIEALPDIDINADKIKEFLQDGEKVTAWAQDLRTNLDQVDAGGLKEVASTIGGAEQQAEALNTQLQQTGDQLDKVNKPLTLKAQLKEATVELQKTQAAFGELSDEAIAAAKRVAQLKDQIRDAQEVADLFDPGKKFQAYTNALSQVAAGFAGVQGAIGLLGVESEDVQKQLLKVQSAMALADGLSKLGEAKKAFSQLATVVKGQLSQAFGSLRSALISTGIGAAVVAVGLLIANFDKVKTVVLNFIPGLAKVGEFLGKVVDKVTDFLGITSEAQRQVEAVLKANDEAISRSERNLEINGDKYDQYTQRKIKANIEFKKRQNEFLKDEKLSEDERNQYIQAARERANRDIVAAEDDRQKAAADIRKKEQEKIDADNKQKTEKAKAAAKALADAEQSAAEELRKIKDDILLGSIKDETERKKKALELQTAEEVRKVSENEKLKAKTKKDLVAAIEAKAAQDRQAIDAEQKKQEAEAEKAFQEQLAELKTEIALNSIKDKDQRELQAIQNSYEQQRKAILENEKLTSDQKEQLKLQLAEKEAQAVAAKEDEIAQANADKELARLDKQVSDQTLSFDLRKQALQEQADLLNQYYEQGILSDDEYTKKLAENADRQMQVDKLKTEAQLQNAEKIAGLLGNLSNLFGKQTAAGKVAAIAQATIDTYLSATKAYQSLAGIPVVGPGLGIAAAAAAVASGIKNVKEIIKVPAPGAAPTPQVSAVAPLAPPRPQAQVTQLDQTSINSLGSATTRAYVLESDVTGSQQRIQRIQRAARLG